MADKPVTREEKYLAYLTGDYKGELPKPITRKEKYLYELCLKGMGGEISPEEIKNAVNEYLEKNPVKPGATTEQAQQIERNKTDIGLLKTETNSLKTDLSDLQAEIEGGGGGLTADLKAALDQLAQKVAYIDEDGQDYYDALHNALYPPANLVWISCVYMQSSTVYDTDSLDDLKSDLVVTAHFSDSTTQTVTTYTLSGTLTEGTSTVTISYGGKTTKFNVTVTHNTQEWVDGVPYSFEWDENKYIRNKAPGDEVLYSGWNASPFLNCSGAGHINIHNGFYVSTGYNAWYDENQTWIDKFSVTLGDSSIAVPSNAVYFRVSYDASRALGDGTYTITPMEA